MPKRFRVLLAAILATAVTVAVAGSAYANECVNANKPDGAGNFGDVVFDVTTGALTLPTNPGGQVAGGFADVYLDFDGDGTGDVLIIDDTFASAGVLPAGAHAAAGPGQGVDGP